MQPIDGLRAKKILVAQALTTLVLAAGGLAFGESVAVSVLFGAGGATLANAAFAYWVFKRYRAQEPELLVMRFYGAEVVKIGLVLALFSAAFLLIETINVPVLLGAYFLVQVVPVLLASKVDAVR